MSRAAGALAELRRRLAEAEEALRAIRCGEVDALVGEGADGPQVFTLTGANHPYRVLIESMNEGALTLTTDKVILYANECFARMVRQPLEQVIGGSFRRYLSDADRASLRRHVRRPLRSGSKLRVALRDGAGSVLPVQISIRPLLRDHDARATLGVVVTDLTEARRSEDALRALTRRVVEAQEAERGRVALELHDRITQLLCAALFRTGALTDALPSREARARKAARKLSEMLGRTADEVERISRGLWPQALEHLGLVAVLRSAGAEFADRSNVRVSMAFAKLSERLPPDTELALFRIFQEALRNVAAHAQARRVTVSLTRRRSLVRLSITDDGVGFDPARLVKRSGLRSVGLLSMRERASYVGGVLVVASAPGAGTTVRAQVPLAVAEPIRERTTSGETGSAGRPSTPPRPRSSRVRRASPARATPQ